ncbi:MAG: hypothetical protein IKO28_05270 [Prevotella sp.]|nr:hypothetical protein [Prevotella sp.]
MHTSAENFKVLSINHGIIYADGKKLIKGSIFDSKCKITWSDNKQIMKVVDLKSRKINILAAQLFKVGRIATVKDLLVQKRKLLSRDGVLNNSLDFARYFNRDFALMHSFSVETFYNFDRNHFLFLQYENQGETINKRLNCTEHSVQFNDSIFSIDGRPFEPVMLSTHLYYYDATNGNVTLLADKLVIHIAPREPCASFINSIKTEALTNEELTGLANDYCHIYYPNLTFVDSDIASFVNK